MNNPSKNSTQTQTPNINERYERCSICGNDTGIFKLASISSRNFYVEGVGQLCGNCYVSMYNTSTSWCDNILDALYD
tara:strand:- start:77 stop:307 length:231 start_codon:yes stop_codon:yes gene_type:complete